MCDTLVALGEYTKHGVTIFAKNSDRDPNEAQVVEFLPRKRHAEKKVKCTYIEVEQVEETYAAVISRPWWMWGAEMGVNEYGVAIGNEAVFTKEPYAESGLTGMDLVRLGLERAKTAREALDVVTRLLEEYGQGGNCRRNGKLYYHNSFIISDPREAWVLETAGKYWVAERVRGVRSISNALSIYDKWDEASESLRGYMSSRGLERLDFARHFSDFLYTRVAKGVERQRYTQGFLEAHKGELDFWKISQLMRSHARYGGYSPARGSMRDICMHAGGVTRPSQTAGSMIALLYEKVPVVFVTGTSSPCISLYKPVFLEAGLPDLGASPTDRYDPQSYWWVHEALHRKMLVSYPKYAEAIRSEIDKLERELFAEALRLREEFLAGRATTKDMLDLTRQAFEAGAKLDKKWSGVVRRGVSLNLLFEIFWLRVNREAGITV
ncbi:C69 family dipeptidase [Infirmifilum sp. NZ]|uniref:C69 family dipeptidase n=1 Tax=Infirmifilum sp. NZ TaxID=2926850 RepID=UPI002798EDF0|nr:C69 family dipeptidase [Infirmifilum sp. NZ]UNQ73052.1 C69 family dipeptidase [Infirmifilum sp. NZ]